LVGCLRRIMAWSLNSTLSEFKTYAANRTIRLGDEQFIEFFDVDLVTLPKLLPIWFVEQRKMQQEEEEELEQKENEKEKEKEREKEREQQDQEQRQTQSQTQSPKSET